MDSFEGFTYNTVYTFPTLVLQRDVLQIRRFVHASHIERERTLSDRGLLLQQMIRDANTNFVHLLSDPAGIGKGATRYYD
jgi:hypothetical protein